MHAKDIGNEAENIAKQYLLEQGLTYHSNNYHSRAGEIDLVMRDQQEWVFVEVKYRSNSTHGSAIEYFHAVKRHKFTQTVKHFMHQQRLNPATVPHRIDVIAIDGKHISWFKCV